MKKIKGNLWFFAYIFWFVSIISSPVFVLKGICTLGSITGWSGFSAFAVVISIWAVYVIAGTMAFIKPWREKEKSVV